MSLRPALVSSFVVLALAATGLTAPGHADPPDSFSSVEAIPGTLGEFNHDSATAADGTDIVLWVAGGSGDLELKSKVRGPGRTAWKRIPARVANRANIQEIDIAPIGAGDFQVAWVQYKGGFPEVYTARVNSKKRTWSSPTKVFRHKDYKHGGPSVGVSGNGTVVISGYAQPKESTSPPTYRTVVAVREPGGKFKSAFLSGANTHSSGGLVAVSHRGHLLVSYIVGYNLAEMTVHAATRAPNASKWKKATLSVAGDAQKHFPAIGANGRAAVVWPADSQTSDVLRISTAQVGSGTPTWAGQVVAPAGGGSKTSPMAAVAPDGDVTVVWQANTAGQAVLTSRQLTDDTFGAPVPLTESGSLATAGTFVMRPDGRAALLYGLYEPSPVEPLGLRHLTLHNGTPSPVVTLTDNTAGEHNQFRLGVDAASRGNVVWVRGWPPETADLVWMGQGFARPDVMTSPWSGKAVDEASIKKLTNHRLRCDSGFWVEASSRSFAWFRNGAKIPGATKQVYQWGAADQGMKLTCKVTGKNAGGGNQRTLTSPPHKVT